jgi:ribosomal protein L11 methyltransferase
LAEYPALDLHFLDSPGPDPHLRERVYVVLDDFEPSAIHEDESGDSWRVFFRTAALRDAAAAHLATAVSDRLLATSALDVPDEDWARRSQESLKAVDVGRLIVAPPWDIPGQARQAPDARLHPDLPVIVIEPSTGFGTGHHPTTRLCLRLLQALDLRGARVIDIGTGSGVLALAAWKLGASDVVAIDNDPDALDNARANCARNGAGGAIEIICDDLGELRLAPADLVLANLTAAALVRHADALAPLARPRGSLILSGFALDHFEVDVRPAFPGFDVTQESSEDGWTAALLTRADPRGAH